MSVSRILVYRIGALGDTLVSVPALWAIREHFANAHITMLCDYHIRARYVLAADLLRGSGIVDDFMMYPVDPTPRGRKLRPLRMAKLLMRLRLRRFDAVVYLAPAQRLPEQVVRDERFFRLAGIKTILAEDGFYELPPKIPGQPLPPTPLEADMLLQRLSASGIKTPDQDAGRNDLALHGEDDKAVEKWLSKEPEAGRGGKWIAIGPGSKMPAKVWPATRYLEVVKRLIDDFDVWPVVFGGPEDRDVGKSLIEGWGRGSIAAGKLGLRASASALSRCALYLGNDTGTMHLAASAQIPCVALFSARSHPHQWDPYGTGHRVFRTRIDCEGCMLVDCIERKKECLMRIEATPVYDACAEILGSLIGPQSRPAADSDSVAKRTSNARVE